MSRQAPDLPVKFVTSRDNPFFKELKKLATSARQRRKVGRTLLDGSHLVRAYLDSGRHPLHVLVSASALRDGEIGRMLQELPAVPLTQLDDSLFAELSELKTPTGLLALVEQPNPAAHSSSSGFCLLLEDIQDPGNLGSMIRTAAAAGCDAVFLSKGCADAWSPKVLRGGMGGHFVLDIHEAADLPTVAETFPGEVYAAALQARHSLYECNLRDAVAFAIGNEGAGLSSELLDVAHPVSIPMPGKVESLNAAAAAAVCLFEAARQRK